MEIPKEISLDYLETLDNGNIIGPNGRKGMVPLTTDVVFKNLFESLPDIFKRFLISVLHLDLKPEECNLIFKDKEILGVSSKNKKNVVDFNVEINDNLFVNIEMNGKEYAKVKTRNYLYESRIITQDLKTGEDYEKFDEKTYIQLNLNVKDTSVNIGEDIIYPYSVITKTVFLKNEIIYLRYLDYYYRLYYNQNIEKSESDYWLAMLKAKNYKELYKMLDSFLDIDLRNKIVRKVIEISMDTLFTDEEWKALDKEVELSTQKYYDDMYKEKYANGYEDGQAKGLEQGIEQGIEQGKLETAKKMLVKNIDIDTIVEITGLPKEQIEALN